MAAVPDAKLVIVGDGDERAALERQAAGLGSVKFIGATQDPAPFLRAADAAVLPSRTEGLPVRAAAFNNLSRDHLD